MSVYQEAQRQHQIDLIKSTNLFENTKAGAKYKNKERDFVLLDGKYNLFNSINNKERECVLNYFETNNISWWGGKNVSGHVLSSQIACLNHLFPLRNNAEALKDILNAVTKIGIKEILPIPDWLDKNENDKKHYIAFETISQKDHLNETKDGGKLTRGSNCTSIDALILAKDNNNTVWIIPIEWKYTEFYQSQDKSKEDRSNEKKGSNGKGKERMSRYCDLITKSKQLKSFEEYKGSIYFQEPFYQLMRQTLWAEQVVCNEPDAWYGAKRYLHIHIVPDNNLDLLNKNYRRFQFMKDGMEKTWKDLLKDKSLYCRIDPSCFLQPIKSKYSILYEYLQTRYWK